MPIGKCLWRKKFEINCIRGNFENFENKGRCEKMWGDVGRGGSWYGGAGGMEAPAGVGYRMGVSDGRRRAKPLNSLKNFVKKGLAFSIVDAIIDMPPRVFKDKEAEAGEGGIEKGTGNDYRL